MNQVARFPLLAPVISEGISLTLDQADILKPDSGLSPHWIGAGGLLFAGDCMNVLPGLRDGSVDTVFADPPFNLGKLYGPSTDDDLAEEKYLAWCEQWLAECIRVLKPGGALFLYNLPKWNIPLGARKRPDSRRANGTAARMAGTPARPAMFSEILHSTYICA